LFKVAATSSQQAAARRLEESQGAFVLANAGGPANLVIKITQAVVQLAPHHSRRAAAEAVEELQCK
jgi:hypothetical protein